jgi:hypothetical protein
MASIPSHRGIHVFNNILNPLYVKYICQLPNNYVWSRVTKDHPDPAVLGVNDQFSFIGLGQPAWHISYRVAFFIFFIYRVKMYRKKLWPVLRNAKTTFLQPAKTVRANGKRRRQKQLSCRISILHVRVRGTVIIVMLQIWIDK